MGSPQQSSPLHAMMAPLAISTQAQRGRFMTSATDPSRGIKIKPLDPHQASFVVRDGGVVPFPFYFIASTCFDEKPVNFFRASLKFRALFRGNLKMPLKKHSEEEAVSIWGLLCATNGISPLKFSILSPFSSTPRTFLAMDENSRQLLPLQ